MKHSVPHIVFNGFSGHRTEGRFRPRRHVDRRGCPRPHSKRIPRGVRQGPLIRGALHAARPAGAGVRNRRDPPLARLARAPTADGLEDRDIGIDRVPTRADGDLIAVQQVLRPGHTVRRAAAWAAIRPSAARRHHGRAQRRRNVRRVGDDAPVKLGICDRQRGSLGAVEVDSRALRGRGAPSIRRTAATMARSSSAAVSVSSTSRHGLFPRRQSRLRPRAARAATCAGTNGPDDVR